MVSPHASLVSISQETEYSTHEHCRFCWSKTFWWGDSCATNSISPTAYSCLPICAAGAGHGYFERGGKMAFFLHSPQPPPPPGNTSPPPPSPWLIRIQLWNQIFLSEDF